MPQLRDATKTIHADPEWWRKILIGGALWMTIVGWPIVEGHQLESVENSHRGFATPLPFWNELGNKAVVGIFALVIDFFYFVFPIMIAGMLSFCVTVGATISGVEYVPVLVTVAAGLLGLYLLIIWTAGISAVAKQHYVLEGDIPEAMSMGLVRTALRAPARRLYLRARLQSVPPYALAAGVLGLAIFTFGWSFLAGLVLLWLGLSTLVYARLVAVQLYLAATRDIERLRFNR